MLTPKKKLTRREMKQDKLVTTWFKVNDYLSQHLREVLLAVGGVVIIAGVIIFFNYLTGKDEQEASEKFAQARTKYNQQNYTAAIPLLEKLVSEHGGSKSAGLATIYLANAYMQTKDYANAEKYYQKYLDDMDNDPILGVARPSGWQLPAKSAATMRRRPSCMRKRRRNMKTPIACPNC
jgi:predicted negative regulator of RcsB-dependent stress response